MDDLATHYAAYAAMHLRTDEERREDGPFSQRTQIWQRFCDGKSLSVIARALGIDRQTAARHVHAIQDELAESDREIHQLALLQAVQSQLAIQAAAMDAYRAEVALEEDYRATCAFDHAQATKTAQTHHPNIHRDWLPPGTPTASSSANALPPYRAQRARLLAIASQAAWRAALLQGLPARPAPTIPPDPIPAPVPPPTAGPAGALSDRPSDLPTDAAADTPGDPASNLGPAALAPAHAPAALISVAPTSATATNANSCDSAAFLAAHCPPSLLQQLAAASPATHDAGAGLLARFQCASSYSTNPVIPGLGLLLAPFPDSNSRYLPLPLRTAPCRYSPHPFRRSRALPM